MPIAYIHGVSVRDPRPGRELRTSFARWLAPVLNPAAPGSVGYVPIFWGDIAAKFRWSLQSRPETALLRAGAAATGQGIARTAPAAIMRGPAEPAAAPAAAGPVVSPVAAPAPLATAGPSATTLNLSAVALAARADYLVDLFIGLRDAAARDRSSGVRALSETDLARLPDVAAAVADEKWDQTTGADAQKLTALLMAIDARLSGVVAAGASDWLSKAAELVKRTLSLPGDVVSTFLAETRPALNGFVANFLGDVLVYVNERGDAASPGLIPRRVLAGLRQLRAGAGNEPIIVVTHSMGGQLFYDAITCFADGDPDLGDLEIDHWISCGSQVSFFAELGQFIAQDPTVGPPQKLARPSRVKKWTNFYDPNDFVGFVMRPVFTGVQDSEYNTGYGLMYAHSGFLTRPSFFAAMAKVIGG